MKRFLVLTGAVVLCMFMIGCGPDSRVGLVKDTIVLLDDATTKITNIKSRVTDAITKYEETKKPLDLSDAIKATEDLKGVGNDARNLKKRIDQAGQIPEEDRKAYAKDQQSALSTAFSALLKQRNELRAELAKADNINRTAVQQLREKLVEAESPFEALAKQ